MGGEIYSSCNHQDKPHTYPPLLVKTANYQSGVVCLFLQCLLALCVEEPVLDFTWGAPKVVNQ